MAQWEVLDISSSQTSLNYDDAIQIVDGIVIRAGYCSYETEVEDAQFVKDKMLDTHYTNLKDKTKIGYYWVSNAINEEEAAEEADFCYLILQGKQNDFPVYFYSNWGNESHNGRADDLDRARRTSICLAWASKMREHGFDRLGVYADDNWFKTRLLISYLKDAGLTFWVIKLGTFKPSYVPIYDGWNYTQTGELDDEYMLHYSYFYKNIADWPADTRTDINDYYVTLDPTVCIYDDGNPLEPTPTISTLVEGIDYAVTYDNNINIGLGICTCEGIGNFYGIINKTFKIRPKSIETEYVITLAKTSYEFTNSPIIPEYSIEGLEPGVDYTIYCTNNLNPGQATIYATGIGNYTGTISTNYIVYTSTDMSTKQITLVPNEMTFDGTDKCPTVYINGLFEDADFTVSYINNINAGTAIARATGIGDYTGYTEKEFTILPVNISTKIVNIDADNIIYDGTAKTPTVSIDGLVQGIDYTVVYSNNINAGKGRVDIYGQGNYDKVVSKTFTIKPKTIEGMTLTVNPVNVEYTGEPVTTTPIISGLVYEQDFTATFYNNINVGTANVEVYGIGNYTGVLDAEYTVVKASISGKTLTFDPDRLIYTGSALKPTPIIEGLVLNTDYTISYSNNINVGTATGTATGKGNYKDSTNGSFTIVSQSIESYSIVLDETNFIYDGSAIEPLCHITGLIKDTDYIISYENNINAGTGTIIANGIGDYAGTITKDFTIKPCPIDSYTVNINPSSYIYNGTAKYPNVSITGLVLNTDFTVRIYDNLNAGTAHVDCTGIGNYTGVAQGTFTIEVSNINNVVATISPTIFEYNGQEKKPTVYINTLNLDVDYYITYENNIEIGIGFVCINGIGNYYGVQKKPFTITKCDIESNFYVDDIPDMYYDGTNEPPIFIHGDWELIQDVDYTISYYENDKTGIAVVEVDGIGNYTGTIVKHFNILTTSLRSALVKLGTPTIYSEYRVNGPIVITYGDYTLVENVDYKITNRIEENFGDFTLITFVGTGINNFNNGRTYRFRVIPTEPEPGPEYPEYYDADDGTNIDAQGRRKGEDPYYVDDELIDINSVEMNLRGGNSFQYDFDRKVDPKFDSMEVVLNRDYTATYSNDIIVGIANVFVMGIGDYTGGRDFTYTITPRVITYNGYIDCGEPDERGHYDISKRKVIYRNERELVAGIEYSEVLNEYIDPETDIIYTTITVTGVDNFTGIISTTFDSGSTSEDINLHEILLNQNNFTYNRGHHYPIPESPTLVLNRDYKVTSYEDNVNVGVGKVNLAGIGKHSGTRTLEFNIIPCHINDAKIDIGEIVDESYDHSAVRVITSDNYTLDNTTDVDLSFDDYEIGDLKVADITATGKGNYTDSVTKRFYLNDSYFDIGDSDVHTEQSDYVFTGEVIKPEVLSDDRIYGIDYEVEYDEYAINVGNYQVRVVGIGNYSGSYKLLSFYITPLSLAECIHDCGEPEESGYYNPENFEIITSEGAVLVSGEDYILDQITVPNYDTGCKDTIFTAEGINNCTGLINAIYQTGSLDAKDIPTNPESIDDIKARVPIYLTDAPVYARSSSKLCDSLLTGIYLIYDSNIENDRVRVVKNSHAFENPCMITGWVDLDDILEKNIPFVVGDAVLATGTLYQYSDGTGMMINKEAAVLYITYLDDSDEPAEYPYGLSTELHTSIIGYCKTDILKHYV